MKKLISGFIAGIIVSMAVTTFAQSSNVRLLINGRDYTNSNALDVPPQIVNDRVMVPLRFVAETLDAYVDWDPTTRTVRVTSASTSQQQPTNPTNPTPSTPAPAPSNGISSIYTATPDKASYDETETAAIRISATKATTSVRIVDRSNNTVAESTNFSADTEGNYFTLSVPLSGLGNALHEYKVYGANAAGNASVAKNVSIRVESAKPSIEIKDVTLDKSTVEREKTINVTVKTSTNVDKIAVADSAKDGDILKTKTSTSSETSSAYTWTISFTSEDRTGTYSYYVYAYDRDGKYVAEKFTVVVENASSSPSSSTKLKINKITVENKSDIVYYNDYAEITVRTSKDIRYIEIFDKDRTYINDEWNYNTLSDYYEFEAKFRVKDEGTYYVRAFDQYDDYVEDSFTISYND